MYWAMARLAEKRDVASIMSQRTLLGIDAARQAKTRIPAGPPLARTKRRSRGPPAFALCLAGAAGGLEQEWVVHSATTTVNRMNPLRR
jgi:hypothetical protein